jgi:hypothetical protein
VKTLVDEKFRLEVARFGLRFTCEHCAHFASDTERCAHGYPVAAHRALVLDDLAELEFCKEFELM